MIRYDLQDADGNTYELNGTLLSSVASGTLTYTSEQFTIENQIKQKSAGAGAVALGDSRIKSRSLSLSFERILSSDTEYIQEENELISFLPKAVYLLNVDSDKRVPIRVTNYSLKYDKGSHKLCGSGTIKLEMLTPFWEAITCNTTTASITGGSQEDVSFTIEGYYQVQPVVTLTASALCETLELYLNTTDPDDRVGINVNDPLFGTSGYETLIIDCSEGTIMLGTLDRSQFIEEGTGFFNIEEGDAVLTVIPSEDIDISICYNPRYFL